MSGDLTDYRWEYSPLARIGNWLWRHAIDPILRSFADDETRLLRRIRGTIQFSVALAILVLPLSFFWQPGHVVTASGLLFDIAGALRLFLLEEIEADLSGFEPNEFGNLPSVAMRELVMPEATGPYHAQSAVISQLFYKKRGVLLLFVGFVLQLLGAFLPS